MSKVRYVCALLSLAAFGTVTTDSRPAQARTKTVSGYSKAVTYNGALRYLRVDLGYKITERDPDAAYLLFSYKPSGEKRHLNGSIEIVEAKGKVRLYVQIPQMPKYHEKVLSDGLKKKLYDEYGEPHKPKKNRDSEDKSDSKDDDKSKNSKNSKRGEKDDDKSSDD